MKLKAIKSKGSLSDKAYNTLKKSILNLELEPGEIIREDQISEELGISRTPLRAALQRLSFESFIEVVPGKGTCVTDLSLDFFLQLFDLREVIEILSVKLAALNRTEEDIQEIRRLIDIQMEIAKEKPLDREMYWTVDRQIHLYLAKCSKNSLVEEQVIRLNESYNRYLRSTEFSDRAVTVVREHMLIVDAIEERDSIKASNIMEHHLRDVKESIIVSMLKRENIKSKQKV